MLFTLIAVSELTILYLVPLSNGNVKYSVMIIIINKINIQRLLPVFQMASQVTLISLTLPPPPKKKKNEQKEKCFLDMTRFHTEGYIWYYF